MDMSPLIVRPLASAEEYAIFFRLADTAFSAEPSEESAQRWQHLLTHRPDFHPDELRGAFYNDQLMGGYILYDRVLCMGMARLATGCIGAVVTAPDNRKQGVASALMRDSQDRAREKNFALLLLDGIPKFYYRYGYTNMFDASAVDVDRSAILAQAPSAHRVRSATVDDAPVLLALYQRHLQPYTGSFARSLESQTYSLSNMRTPLLVAVSPEGLVEGYLFHRTGEEMSHGIEIAAENRDALLALLQHHAHLFAEDAAPKALHYFLPLDAPMVQWMVDVLEVPDTSQWTHPSLEWGVLTQSYHHRFTGWMACLTSFPILMRSILPELQARWQRGLAQWSGEIALTVNGETRTLHINGPEIQLTKHNSAAASHLELTPQAMIQWVFGYRPLSQLTSIAHLSSDASAALAMLFPRDHTWIPMTDWF
ncbi:MAG TPA: GNAT family N-acetyltransferase [Ktedonosporobacter sp.]|jgi:predicted acetyltransferase|nr:GNAT family N-acetyltransferase [Ktedonosporobacter sp.]